MNLQTHVFRAIEAMDRGHKADALMHACIAIEGTARNLRGADRAGNQDYKNCLRKYYWIIERFMAAGINLDETKWNNISLDNGFGKEILAPDLADIIYHVFRCSLAHAKEVPIEFELLPCSMDEKTWLIGIADRRVQMPESIIFGLLAVSVFCSANAEIKTDSGHYLTWQSPAPSSQVFKFELKDWWRREKDLAAIFEPFPITRIKLNL